MKVATLGVDAEAVNGGQVAYDTVNQLNMRADPRDIRVSGIIWLPLCAVTVRFYRSIVNEHLRCSSQRDKITLEDGSEKEVQLMAEVVDLATGERQVLNDIRGAMKMLRMLDHHSSQHEAAKPRRNS